MGKSKPYEPPTEPWERQRGESHEAFSAFAAYRDMGTGGAMRSTRKLAQKIGIGKGEHYDAQLRKWSVRWRWQERCAAWDDEQDRMVREELTKGVTAMRKKHAEIANQMMLKALKALQKIPDDELTMQDVTRAVDIASKLERISRGEPTEKTEGKQSIAGEVSLSRLDLSNVSDEDLNALDELAGKIFTG